MIKANVLLFNLFCSILYKPLEIWSNGEWTWRLQSKFGYSVVCSFVGNKGTHPCALVVSLNIYYVLFGFGFHFFCSSSTSRFFFYAEQNSPLWGTLWNLSHLPTRQMGFCPSTVFICDIPTAWRNAVSHVRHWIWLHQANRMLRALSQIQ